MKYAYVIRSDESSFMLFPASGRVYVCRMAKEQYNPECMVPTVKHGDRSVIIWTAISWNSAGPLITLNAASDYVDILGDQVHRMVQMFRKNNTIFQDDNSRIHTNRKFSFSLRSMKTHCSIFSRQHNR